jgi:fimbrial chaperone protein
MQFEAATRSAVVGINNSDKRPIRFQLTLVEWTQDAKGEDIYTPSDDLIFFPRQFTVQAGDRSIARVGPKQKPGDTEKTYRLRVEELPEPVPEEAGSGLSMTITFAIPIFVGTPDAKPQAVLAPVQLQNGILSSLVQNVGRSQFRIDSLELQGADGYSQKIGGWYLLAGASRQYSFPLPPDVCKTQKHLNLTVSVGENHFVTGLDMDPSQCGT